MRESEIEVSWFGRAQAEPVLLGLEESWLPVSPDLLATRRLCRGPVERRMRAGTGWQHTVALIVISHCYTRLLADSPVTPVRLGGGPEVRPRQALTGRGGGAASIWERQCIACGAV